MREIRQSGLEGGVAVTRHPYPYFEMYAIPEQATSRSSDTFWGSGSYLQSTTESAAFMRQRRIP
jgi:hypothetical protein